MEDKRYCVIRREDGACTMNNEKNLKIITEQ